jgi:SpoVK/Ycf46/Vps4 family AAA+-type ATPase
MPNNNHTKNNRKIKKIHKKKTLKNNTSILEPNNKFKGGGFSIYTYEELKKTIIVHLLENKTSYRNLIQHYINFFTNKIIIYNELLKKMSSNNTNIITADIIAKNTVYSQLPTNIPDGQKQLYQKQLYDDNTKILLAYQTQSNIAIIQDTINKVKNKIKELTDNPDLLQKQIMEGISYLDSLTSISINELKKELCENIILISRGNYKLNYSPYNLLISGNPGIGKSYLADILRKVYYSFNFLATNNFISIKKPDVIGEYIGTTAPKIYSKLLSGLESVIFLDEAYSFAGKKIEDKGYDVFGTEALNALTDFSSEYIGLLSIIAAGYKYEMETQFLDVNPGLRRRFPLILELKRYTPYELYNIGHKTLITDVNKLPNINDETKQIFDDLYTLILIIFDKLFNYTLIKNSALLLENNVPEINKYNITINILKQLETINLNIVTSNNTVIPLIQYNQITKERSIFNIKNNNQYSFEWFVLVYTLQNCCNLKNGDLYNFQSASIINITNIIVNNLLIYSVNNTNITDILSNNLIVNIILSIIQNYNIEVKISDSTIKNLNIYLNDGNLFMDKFYINNNTTVEHIKKQLFNCAKIELEKIIKINDKSTERDYMLYSLNELNIMNK